MLTEHTSQAAAPQTPYEHAVSILSQPVGCGYKVCRDEGVVFGCWPPMPYNDPEKQAALTAFEQMILDHRTARGHRREKLIWITEPTPLVQ